MEKFTPQKIDLAAINKGNRYGYGGIEPDAINRPIEASAYAQEIAESVKGLALNQPDSSQADMVGTPTVEISGTGENAKFVFKSLKGEKGLTGPSGVASGTVNSNAEGTSDTDGYTQQAVNKIASRPNLIINPDFSINQRGATSYTGTGYGVDRWKGYQFQSMICTPRNGYGVTLSAPIEETSTGGFYFQPFEAIQLPKLAGRTVTVSFKVSANRGTARIYVRTSANKTNTGDTPNINSGMTGVVSKTINLPSPLTSLEIIFRKGEGTLDVDIDWVKLEIGSTATAFVPPLIAEELPKCQRYMRLVYGFKRAVNGYQFYEPFQAFYGSMRISPTITHQYSVSPNGVIGTTENGLYDISSNSEINVSVNPRGYINEYGCTMQNGDGTFTVDHTYRYVLYVDAEIYS